MPLVAVKGDKNTHGKGALLIPPQTKWKISGKLVCTVDTIAEPDLFGHAPTVVDSSTGSSKFSVAGKKIHRHGDSRYCLATTIVTGQTKFTVGA